LIPQTLDREFSETQTSFDFRKVKQGETVHWGPSCRIGQTHTDAIAESRATVATIVEIWMQALTVAIRVGESGILKVTIESPSNSGPRLS
jgi:hypothetical protein